ncbi:MAG: TraB/GumN family protein [Granulosicoccaceae bacterium]|jgi:uncharacterized protein YbaP (TraB family)
MQQARQGIGFTLLLWLWLFGLAAQAEPQITFLPAAQESMDRGLLWQISSAQGKTSYLFGTIHVDDPAVINLPTPVSSAFNRCDSLTLELLPNPDLAQQSIGMMLFQDGRTLASVAGNDIARRSVQALAARGMPRDMVMRMKPWAVMVTLSVPENNTGQFLDFRLYERAIKRGMHTHALETYTEQVGIFDAMSMREQTRLLENTLDELDTLPGFFRRLTQAWLTRDLKALQAISDEQMPADDPTSARLMHDLVDKRNRNMLERIQPRLREGNAFIAVGALHLPGEEGLINLLRGQGYTVTALY